MELAFGRFTKSCTVVGEDGNAVFFNCGECTSWSPAALARLVDAGVIEEITSAEMHAAADEQRAKSEAARGRTETVGVRFRGRETPEGLGGVPVGVTFFQINECAWFDVATADKLVAAGVAERL